MSFPEQKVVRLYPKLLTDGSLDGAKEVATSGVAVGLAHRVIKDQAVYLVLTTDDRTIHLLDDKTFDEVGKITLAEGTPLGLAVPADEKSAIVYYVCKPGNSDGAVGRVNLDKKVDEGLMDTEDVGEIACSADGRILYGRKPYQSPSGFRAWRISDPAKPGEPPIANLIATFHADSGPYVADPFNALVASGKGLRTLDLSKEVASLPDPVRAFMHTKPVILTATNDGVEAFSYNTFQSVGSITFADEPAQPVPVAPPVGSKPPRRTTPSRSSRPRNEQNHLRVGQYALAYQPFIGVDEKHGVLVYLRDEKVGVAPITALKLPDEPILNVTINGSTEGEIDQPMKLKIDKIDPKTQVTLASGPDGLKLEGDSLNWTPTAQQIGTHRVSLECAAGGSKRTQEVVLVVRRPVVMISFSPEQLVVSQDGKYALATRSSPDNGPQRRVRAGQRRVSGAQGESRVALIDLQNHKLVAERTVPYTIWQAIAVGTDGAYLTSQGANAIYALSLKDLSDTRRVFTNGPLEHLTIVGDALVAYAYQNGQNGTTRYHLPDLEPVNEPQSRRRNWPTQDPGFAERIGDDWYMQGVVRDADGKLKLLIRPDGIAEMSSNPNQPRRFNGRDDFRSNGMSPMTTWGVALMGENLMRLTGQNLGKLDGLDRTLLNDLPVAVGITREEIPNDQEPGQRPTLRVSLEAHDLISAQTRQTIPLFAESLSPYGEQGTYKVIATRGRIVALAGPRAFVVATKELDKKQYPEPVHFEPAQDQFILPKDHPITLKCTASGGKAPLTFEIANDMPGLKIDSKTGEMTVDPAPFLARANDFVQQIFNNNSGAWFRVGQPTSQPSEIINSLAADAQRQFKELTGQDAKGYPVAIPADVLVRDDEQQSAVLNRVVLLDVPIDAVAKKMEQQFAQQRQQQEQFRQQRTAATQNVNEVESLKRRIADLERQNTELEAQNKLLKELVGQSKEDKSKQ